MIRLKLSKYRLYRRRFLRLRRHFLAFFKIYQKIQLKMRQHFKNRINPSHQNLKILWKYGHFWYILIFWLILTIFHILIFHLYFIFVFWNSEKSARRSAWRDTPAEFAFFAGSAYDNDSFSLSIFVVDQRPLAKKRNYVDSLSAGFKSVRQDLCYLI